MSGTKSFSPDQVQLFVGTPPDDLEGTMTVLMKTNKYYTDGSLKQAKVSYTVTREWGRAAVEAGWADDTGDVLPVRDNPSFQVATLQALLSATENPPDTLVAPLQQVHLNAAMSTTAVLTATATSTYNKARVVWNNNGASASAKLYIAVNADNDVHGLMVTQSAKRRDYEMTMGDGVILVCADPITTLAFSADGAVGNGLHSILVTFGA